MVKAKKITKADLKRIDRIVADYREQRWSLIPLLHEIQGTLGYIPPVITFYTQLYTEPRGKNIVRVCRGTACHVRGGKTILKLVKQQLGVEEGETTPDMEYTLETVACIGVCALAPNIVVNQATHGHMNPKKVAYLFSKKEET